jgi:hypothetical protein
MWFCMYMYYVCMYASLDICIYVDACVHVPVCIVAYVELGMRGCLYVVCTAHRHCHDAKFERGGNSVHFLS